MDGIVGVEVIVNTIYFIVSDKLDKLFEISSK